MTTSEQPPTPERGAARPFDFRTPGNGDDGQLEVFARMHDVFAQTLAAAWSRSLRCQVALSRSTIARVTFDDYVRALPTPTVLHEIALEPLGGKAVLELDPELAMIMLDRTLGGQGARGEARRLTTLEEDLLVDQIDQVRTGLAATFDPIVDVAPTLGPMQSDPEFLATVEPTDPVVLVAFQVTVTTDKGSGDAMLTLAYPLSMLGPVLERLQAHGARPEARAKGPIDEALPHVAVEIAVRLAPTHLRTSEIADLRVGDVLKLDHRADDPVTGSVGDAVVFDGHVGRRGPRLAVRVARVRAPEELEDHPRTGTPEAPSAPNDVVEGEDR